MKKHFVRQKNNKSFYFTLLFSFIITSVISALLLTVFLTLNYLNAMVSSIKDYNRQLLSQTNYAIDELDKSVDRIATSLLSNNNIIAFLSHYDPNTTIPTLAARELNNQLLVLSYVDSIYLYNSSKEFIYSSKTGSQGSLENFEDPEAAAHLKDTDFLKSHAKEPVAAHKDPETGGSKIFSYYYPDNPVSSDGKSNIVVINVHVSDLTESISSMKELTSGSESNFILLDEDNNYLTGVPNSDINGNKEWLDSVLPALSSKDNENYSFTTVGKTRYFQINTNANTYGWHLLNFIPTDVAFHDMIPVALLTFLIFIGVLLVTFFICLHFAHRLHTPVETLTRILNEKRSVSRTQDSSNPREFQKILDSVSALLENNQELRSLQQKTEYSLMQDCLNSLVANHNMEAPALLSQKLDYLQLSYLNEEKLCMAVIKIDNYQEFLSSHNPDELWVIRFSVVNIIEELVSASFTGSAFSRTDDKFVLIIASSFEEDDSQNILMNIFHSIQENIDKFLHITVSIAFSTAFHGLENLPIVYKNMENQLLLKMRYGHNCIIDPYASEDVPDEAFHVSYRLTSQLIDGLTAGQPEAAWSEYEKLTKDLFNYDYSEVISSIIHIVYSIYERIIEKYPMLKDDVTRNLKTFLSDLQDVEISEDIQILAKEFLNSICASVQKLKEDPDQQNSSVVAEKIHKIIQREYTSPALCLCSIAEEVGLSANYAGHIFKQQMQKSVSQYILETRMDKLAWYLQNTSMELNKILEKVGLEKNNYFYTRFKNYFGMSLSEYKQKFQISSGEEE